MSRLASIVSGRRGKWLVLVVWVIAFAALAGPGSKLADETSDDTTSYLPESAADAAAVERDEDRVPLTRPPSVPFTPGAPAELVSPDGDVAYTVLTVPTDFAKSADWARRSAT